MEEIPDKVMVPLGRRGFHPLKLKYCHVCGNPYPQSLKLIEKIEYEDVQEGDHVLKKVDYKISCDSCQGTFYIRLQSIYLKDGDQIVRITTTVNILDSDKNDLGWLGSI